jgi:hypothetical protein
MRTVTELDVLTVILDAQIPATLEGTEAAMREIVALLDHADPHTYLRAHARLDQLLTHRAHLVDER